ncbi:MAG: hypothetical protein H8E41_13040 [Desulfobulbaceae bacterium]|uniref:Uncharacterized protein n=1 Tax=Candidatus Desulfobia pelagia TaxID=2841692 RepID=A0A8J6NGM7_9BACT|nr:hypothetical protein [Candidatus Desulfobia pelagia]
MPRNIQAVLKREKDMWRRSLSVLAVIILLSSCAFLEKTEQEALAVAGVRFQNASYYPVAHVRLIGEDFRDVVSCREVVVGTECYTDFPAGQYGGKPIAISWEQNGKTWSTGQIFIEVPEDVNRKKPTTCVVIMGNQGSYNTHFSQ